MPQTIEQLVQTLSAGEGDSRSIRAAARLMSILESQPQRLPELFQNTPLEDWPQPRLVLGITGAPGSGKSTLTDQLISEYRTRYPERKVGVIAVDPSSPFTGGAVLGDRVRMMRHATDPMIFIRSLSSRGHLGGLSLGVKGVLRVMGMIGCDVVFIETVGVGQSEVEIAGVADLVLIVLAPGQGDSIQMLKAGLMEIGDLFVVNKADQEGAAHLHSTLLNTLGLDYVSWQHGDHQHPGGETGAEIDVELADSVMARRRPEKPEVFLVSATEQTGITELVDGLEDRASKSQSRWIRKRNTAVLDEIREAVYEEVRRRIRDVLGSNGAEIVHLQRIVNGEVTVSDLSQELIKKAGEH